MMLSFLFYIETEAGERTEWRGLTRRTALMMYNATQRSTPSDVKSYGWKELA